MTKIPSKYLKNASRDHYFEAFGLRRNSARSSERSVRSRPFFTERGVTSEFCCLFFRSSEQLLKIRQNFPELGARAKMPRSFPELGPGVRTPGIHSGTILMSGSEHIRSCDVSTPLGVDAARGQGRHGMSQLTVRLVTRPDPPSTIFAFT